MWLGPPCMKIEIIARALGSRGGVFGFTSNVGFSKVGLAGAARSSSCASSHASASEPTPSDCCARKCRRLERSKVLWSIIGLVEQASPLALDDKNQAQART